MTTPVMQLIKDSRVKITGYGSNRIFWSVGTGDNKVSIIQTKTKFGDQFTCSCKSCSIGGEAAGICTFIKSVIVYGVLGIKQKDKKQ